MKSLAHRVGNLKITNPINISCVHIFSDDWRTVNQEFTICASWTPVELAEWVFVKVCGMDDESTSLDDDDNMTTGTYNHKITRSDRNIMLEEYSDRNHTNLTFEIGKL